MNGVDGNARVEFSEPEIEPDPRRGVFGQDAFGLMPGAGGRAMHRGIGVENAAPISVERPGALSAGSTLRKSSPRPG